MKRYFFEVAYDGANYHGWQRQENASSVQQVVEEALSTILRTEVSIIGSGRTDTGVHCEQQFFHAELIKPIDPDKLEYQLNSLLPKDISINGVREVKNDGHARFSAIARSYQYHINKRKNPFLKGHSYYFSRPLDVEAMNEACRYLMGEHDFESFSKVKTEVNNFRCHITCAEWSVTKDNLVFNITANRFLRGMVRAIVGTLLQVGQGNLKNMEFKEVIVSKNRKMAGAAAPAHGLFLTSVKYPEAIFNVPSNTSANG